MNLALFDDPLLRTQLLPFTYTRPVGAIRAGVLTIAEKWQHRLGLEPAWISEDYLQGKFPPPPEGGALLAVNGSLCPDDELMAAIEGLAPGQRLIRQGMLLAARISAYQNRNDLNKGQAVDYPAPVTLITRPWHIFKQAGEQIRKDYEVLTHNRQSARITDPHTIVYNQEQVFLEEGVSIKAAIINAENGPVYLGANSKVEEGAVIRGPFGLGAGSVVNAQARMRGDIAIGPMCKVGGEVNNSIIFGYSNKGHDGFLGNSVLGEWCNIGADTNTSNLKNNYSEVKVWDYAKGGFTATGELFCGLFMGDHSKCGINTMFNTGTVVGVAANVFGAGYPRTFIPSFAWGGQAGFTTFRPDKVKEMAMAAMPRRGQAYNAAEEEIINKVFALTAQYRTWEQ